MPRLCAWVKFARVSVTGLLAPDTCVGIFSNAEGATVNGGGKVYQVLRELLPKNRFEPGAPTRTPRRRPDHHKWPSSTSRCESRNAPSGADLAHPPNTIKGSLGKRPVDIGDFIIEFEPTGQRIDRHLGYQGCAPHHRSGRSIVDRGRAPQSRRCELAVQITSRNNRVLWPVLLRWIGVSPANTWR